MATGPAESFNMISQRSSDNTPNESIEERKTYTLSYNALLLLGAIFVCTLLAVSFLVYNFAACDNIIPNKDEDIVCTAIPMRQNIKENNGTNVSQNMYEQDVRLPTSIKPLKYNVSLEPYLQIDNFTFNGEVYIIILVLEDCYNITMHAKDLQISKNDVVIRTLKKKSDKEMFNSTKVSSGVDETAELRIRKQYLLDAKQFFIIELYDKLIAETKYVIKIKFSGLIQDYLQGFYRSSYKVGNETRWLASTQFQATDARRAFPCFDEPALKAKFTLNIARPKNMSTVSNMPIIRTTRHDTIPDYEWDYFDESLPMSTYLVAFSITDFSKLSDGYFSVWARQEVIQSAAYALKYGPKILRFLEKFFDLKFPLPKMDMMALPDFQAGAMENWGLITYRETIMLFEEGVSASTYKQRLAAVVGHELAHQWFGNLVTPSWWSDIWLNEGFASYMEYITADAIQPEWKTMDQFVVNELQNVFQLDALSTSHKISVQVGNPEEITEIFDRISYAKGSTIIRMMSHFLTSNVFKRGLNRYLKEMAYGSAEQDDLWHALTLEAKIEGILDRNATVKDIMDTWTLQVGFPVVHVTKHPNTNIIRLEQHRFAYENSKSQNIKVSKDEALWWIPITYTTSDELNFENTRPLTWIPRSKIYEIENRDLATADWFIFNIQQTGYYRLNYELTNWQAITKHLMNARTLNQISTSNRAQLIDDSMQLARGGYINYDVALNLTRYLINEHEYTPWKAAINSFYFLDLMFVNQGDYGLFKNYILKLVDRVYNELGFTDSTNENDMLELLKRVEILNIACHLGHQGCLSDSVRHFQNWMQVPNPDANNPISPNLRAIIYCTAVQYGTEAEWQYAFERYLKSNVPTEKEIILTALGCSKEPWILTEYLRYSITGDMGIRKQDVYRVFASVASNIVGQKIAFDFIRTNWEEIKTYMGSSMSNFNILLKFATKRMNTKYQLKELETFVTDELKDNSRLSQQITEQVQVNVNWMNKNYQTILKWLQKESKLNS